MTITNAIPELWSARLLKNFVQRNMWRDALLDVSAEIPEGRTLELSKITTAVAVADYTKDTDIADPQIMSDEAQVLTLDKQKYFNIAIDDIDKVQAKPDMMDGFMEIASTAIADQVNTDLQAVAIPANQPDNQSTTFASPVSSITPTDDELDVIVRTFNLVRFKLTQAKWPLDRVQCMINSRLAYQLREYAAKRTAGTGSVSDSAFVNAALSELFGFPTIENPTMDTGQDSDDLQAFIQVREAVVAAYQISEIEPYRLEKRFSDGIKGLFVYGAKVVEAQKQHFIKIA